MAIDKKTGPTDGEFSYQSTQTLEKKCKCLTIKETPLTRDFQKLYLDSDICLSRKRCSFDEWKNEFKQANQGVANAGPNSYIPDESTQLHPHSL